MPRNGSGGYSAPFPDFQAGNTILSDEVDANTADIAQAIQDSIARDGQTVYVGNQPMGGFRHLNVSDGQARNEYPTIGQVQDSAFAWCGTAGGTANAITLTPNPPITAYASGQKFWFRAGATNTDAATISVSGLAEIPVQTGGSPLVNGSINQGLYYQVLFVANTFQLLRIAPSRIGHALLQASTQEAAQAAIGLADLTEVDGLFPVGAVADFIGQNLSGNWIFANGQNLLRAQWPDLFARCGTTFGAGNGSTTFGTPDLRGRVVAGLDTMGGAGNTNRLSSVLASGSLGAFGGAQVHTLTLAQMPSHGHAARFSRATAQAQRPRHADNITPGLWTIWEQEPPVNTTPTSVEGGGQWHPNTQPTMVLNKVIFAGREVPQT